MIERGIYLALAGFCWLAAAALVTAGKRFGAITAAVVTAVVLLGYTGRSAARIPQWGDEIGLFREGLKDAPDPFHPSLYLGEALLRHQRPAEAVAVLNEALRLRPGYSETHNDLGRAWLELGDAERAAHHYGRAAEIWTAENRRDFAARAWNNLGIARRAQQRHGEAIAAYRQALRLDPDLALARNNLGYTLLVENQVEQAVEELRAALARQPGFWQARANLGLAYAMRGQWDPALAELAEAERLSPDNPEVQARIGEVCLARGDRQGARRWFIRALAREPQNARARAGMEAVKRP
jgi:Flp pilus assembly protein TadD